MNKPPSFGVLTIKVLLAVVAVNIINPQVELWASTTATCCLVVLSMTPHDGGKD